MRRDVFSGGLWLRAFCVMALAAGAAMAPCVVQAATVLSGCPVLLADNVWNTPIDQLPVDANSRAYIDTIGADTGLHPDFGSGTWDGAPIGIPYNIVPGSQAKIPVSFEYADESDPGPYPIPSGAKIEGGRDSDGDRHVLVMDKARCILYETYSSYPQSGGSWRAGSGAVFKLGSNALRPADWTSADAAGLPILPGLARYSEVAAGEITHALRFTVPQTRKAYIWPARHYASSLTGSAYPPMGQRFRLKADYDISDFSSQVQVILRALKKYGMILADNGSAWYISGAPDSHWDNDSLVNELATVKGSDFEAVDESGLMVDAKSGQVQSTPNPNPPDRKVRLIFIHHSTGEAWLADDHGALGIALRDNGYFVSDTNYGWGPDGIGDRTDIGHWWTWFRGEGYVRYMNALYAESGQHSGYSRLASNPGGSNEIIMFKSCFPNSALKGRASAAVPAIGSNNLRGQGSDSEYHTVANAKGIYIDILKYFKTKRDKLFIAVAAPPLSDATYSSNARAFNQWLVNDWLKGYPYKNVFVFDFYNVLTTNGGSSTVNDLNRETGNHHRWWNGAIQHKTNGDDDANPNILEYPSDGDDHPNRAGDLKATGEYIKLLNIAYNRWHPALGEALDNTKLEWKTGGSAKWFGETATDVSGGDAAQSGSVGNGRKTWLSTTVVGPGTLKFYWMVSSQSGDTLKFALDGTVKGQIAGTVSWVQKSFRIGAGKHTLMWTYQKDSTGKSGLDAAWVDNVQWTGS